MDMTRNRCVWGSYVILFALGFSFFVSYNLTTEQFARFRQLYPFGRVTSISYQQNHLDCLTNGHWEVNNSVSKERYTYMDQFFRTLRKRFPNPLQRADRRCGNISFDNAYLWWYRAVCDPHQSTPCCYQGTCKDLPTEQCRCDECYDLRQDLHAELSTWTNNESRCQVRDLSRTEVCKALNATEIILVGDSHMQRTHDAFRKLIGAGAPNVHTVPNTPAEVKARCQGANQDTQYCRQYIARDAKACGGNTKLVFRWLSKIQMSHQFLQLTASLLNQSGSLIVIGIGHHDSFNYENISSLITGPVLDIIEKSGSMWPKVIWVGGHSMGTLKSPNRPSQTNPYIIKFNKAMREFVTRRGVTFCDWYNLTRNLQSPDGSHYLRGANELKVRVLLNFLKEIGGVENLPHFNSKGV